MYYSKTPLPIISGYAATLNYCYAKNPTEVEVIRRGAFDRVLRERQKVEVWLRHDRRWAIPGQLELKTNDRGLAFWFRPDNTERGRLVTLAIYYGYLRKCSIGYNPARYGITRSTSNGITTVDIGRIARLMEITLSSTVANPQTYARHVEPPPDRLIVGAHRIPKLKSFLRAIGEL